ncbi:GspH/FimT family protein [Metallibacterium sp.]
MPMWCRVGANVRVGHGFSMMEMLIVLAVVAVLVTLAAPGLRMALIKLQVGSTINALVADLQTARTLAISRGRLVGVVAVNGNWLDGWQIQPDSAPATAGYTAASGAPLRQHEALDVEFSAAAGRGGALGSVVFAQDGSVYDTASNGRASIDTTFSVCKPAGSQAQAMTLVVHASGQMESYRDSSVSGATCS